MIVSEILNLNENQNLRTEEEVYMWLHGQHIDADRAIIHPDLSVSVRDHVTLTNLDGILPVKFARVSGIFSVARQGLSDFTNFPTSASSIYCNDCNFTNFHNIHKVVKQCTNVFDFVFQNCQSDPEDFNYISREGRLPTHLLGFCAIKGLKKIRCDVHGFNQNPIDDLFLKHKGDMLMFQDALIEAGYAPQARL